MNATNNSIFSMLKTLNENENQKIQQQNFKTPKNEL